MRLAVLAVLGTGALVLPPVLASADTTERSAATATSYCRSLHRAHPATYHHRYGRDRHSFGRCTTDWRHDHRGHDHNQSSGDRHGGAGDD